MPLQLEIVKGAGSVTVVVAGDIDMDSRHVLDDAIARLEAEPVDLVLDLAGVTFVDSQGVNLLVRVRKILEQAGVSLTITRPSPMVRKVLEVTRVDSYIDIVYEARFGRSEVG
jgi:anti-sigma B factor antagonist